ncbi:MAG: PIN domain-containing protein [Candidatus Marinimicrobia bacterium]|nr:PIN domain-containing protein [Candidatus Neomarinimicrobiota bacterium]MCF7830188.1 PIN domain-containing protein [Candidatus Neomarinimicrobiota bacterium]MCF7882078.1 PIN domain-containing protein [Candidatus Neomarinimicrobiota bacterium]
MKLNSIFVDTAAILGLFKPNDYLKEISKTILAELLDDYDVNLVTTNWVQYEALSALKQFGFEYCERFSRFIDKDILKVYRINKQYELKGLQTFWRYKDKAWGIVDCTSMEFMFSNSLIYVFTDDNDFAQAGLLKLITSDKSGTPIKNYSMLSFFE